MAIRQIVTGAGSKGRELPTGASVVSKPSPAEVVGGRDIVKEIPGAIGKTFNGIANTFVPAITNFFKTTGGIIGEGIAYATDPEVRKQYLAGNTDILPTVTKTTQKDLALDTVAAGIETAVYMSFPKMAQMTLAKRGGAGALQGIGAAVAAGMAEDKSPQEIMKSLPAYGVGGSVIAVVSPYLIPLLKSQLGKATPEIKNMIRGVVQEAKMPGIKPPVMPEVPTGGGTVVTESGVQQPVKSAVPRTVRSNEPVQVVRTTDEFQSLTAEKFRQEAIKRGLPDPGEVPLQQVQHNVDRWRTADEIVNNNPDDALDMLRGTVDAPAGIRDGDLYGALRNRLLNDIDYARANPKLIQDVAQMANKGTEAGQTLQSFSRQVGDTDPFKAINDINKARSTKVATQMELPKGAKPNVKAEINKAVDELSKQQIKLEQANKLIDEIRNC